MKPSVNREKLTVLGKYIDSALTLAGKSQSDLARLAGYRSSSYLSRVLKGERTVDRETLLTWCALLDCPDWLAERILNAAGYASERQLQFVSAKEMVEETHNRVLKEVEERARQV